MSDKEFTAVLIAALAVGFVLLLGLGFVAENEGKQDTLKDGYSRGYTEYCQISDSFTWRGECQ